MHYSPPSNLWLQNASRSLVFIGVLLMLIALLTTRIAQESQWRAAPHPKVPFCGGISISDKHT